MVLFDKRRHVEIHLRFMRHDDTKIFSFIESSFIVVFIKSFVRSCNWPIFHSHGRLWRLNYQKCFIVRIIPATRVYFQFG